MRSFKKILVTGGAGFIGSELVLLLLGEGFEVVAVDDLSKGERSRLPKENKKFSLSNWKRSAVQFCAGPFFTI